MSGQHQIEFSADVYAALAARAADDGQSLNADWIAEQLLGEAKTPTPEDQVQKLLRQVPADVLGKPLKDIVGHRVGVISEDGPSARDVEEVVGDIIMEKFENHRP